MTIPSKSKSLPIAMFVESLRYLMPPQTVIHIGAGTGQGMMHRWQKWNVPCALIVEADEARLAWTNDLLAIHAEWKMVATGIAEQDIETDYYRASNPNEDGLISPVQLSELWSNLQTKEQKRVQTQSLDSLLDTTEFLLSKASVTWTIIDCLSTLDILKGAKRVLEVSSVLWLRVFLQPLSSQNEIATIKEIELFLHDWGYRCVNVTESNHPSVGEAIFVRDWHVVSEQKETAVAEIEPNQIQHETTITQLQNENASVIADKFALEQLLLEQDAQRIALHQEKSVMEAQILSLQNELSIFGNERDEQLQLVANGLVQIETLSQTNHQLMQEKSAIEIQIQSFQHEIAAVSNDWNEQKQRFESEITQLRNEIERLSHDCLVFSADKSALENLLAQQSEQRRVLQNEMLTLAQARDEQTQLANARQVQIESLSQSNAQLQQEKSAIETQVQSLQNEISGLTKARDEQNQIIVQNKILIDELRNTLLQNESRVTQLETHLTESDARQKMLNEEIIKAEAQIELIKDVLLRESEV